LIKDGSVKCWGTNNYGELGDGTTYIGGRNTPVNVVGLSDAVAIAAGLSHTCALIKDGSVKCWGWNVRGQLGDGTNIDKTTPVNVVGLSDAVAIAAGPGHTCALIKDGSVKCWGWNGHGQLGDGTKENDRLIPVTVLNYNFGGIYEKREISTTIICRDGEIYNPEKKECIKEGIGCYSNDECFEIYKNDSVVCSDMVNTPDLQIPGHCCLKGKIWNGTDCEEKKLRIVVIPYKKSWEQLGTSEDNVKRLMENVIDYFPIAKNKVKITVMNKVCTPPLDQFWVLCPTLVGAPPGDRFVVIGDDNLAGECCMLSLGDCPANGCVSNFASNILIVRTLDAKHIAHELGHTFGLKEEYCHFRHLILGWLCGEEAYPNPLKEEYGCKVSPTPICYTAKLKTDKQQASPGELVGLTIDSLEGNACEAYLGEIVVDGINFGYCVPGEPCYISFDESWKGKHKIKVNLLSQTSPSLPKKVKILDAEIDVPMINEVEVNVEGSYKETKLFGDSCFEDKLTLSLHSLWNLRNNWEKYARQKPIWFKIVKNSIFEYKIGSLGNSEVEIYDENCRRISGGKTVTLRNNGIYNIKVYGSFVLSANVIPIEDLGFCCVELHRYGDTCLGNMAIDGKGRSIMAGELRQKTHFSKPAWEHLKEVLKEWRE
jgi:hypothetical protein